MSLPAPTQIVNAAIAHAVARHPGRKAGSTTGEASASTHDEMREDKLLPKTRSLPTAAGFSSIASALGGISVEGYDEPE